MLKHDTQAGYFVYGRLHHKEVTRRKKGLRWFQPGYALVPLPQYISNYTQPNRDESKITTHHIDIILPTFLAASIILNSSSTVTGGCR